MKIKNSTKITIYPTKTVIEGYEYNPKIERSLTVWDKVRYCPDFQAFLKYEDENKIIIPNSYYAPYISKLFDNAKLVDKRFELNQKLKEMKQVYPVKINFDCRDDIQREAIEFLNRKTVVGSKKYRAMQSYLCLRTGKGKTFCTIKYIVDNEDRPIIFMSDLSLIKQWKEKIMEYTDTTEEEIYVISGKSSINKLMKMSDMNVMKIKFFLAIPKTFMSNIKNNQDTSGIKKLLDKIRINLRVYDEAHFDYKSLFLLEMISNVRSVYLSATPSRSNIDEDKVYQHMFYTVPRFFGDNKVSIEKDNKKYANTDKEIEEVEMELYHNIIEVKWSSKPTPIDEINCHTKYGFSMPKYFNYIENDRYDEFFILITHLLFDKILKVRKKKVAILFGSISMIKRFTNDLANYIEENNLDYSYGEFHGQIKGDEKEKVLLDTDLIITTDKSFEKGLDVKDLEVVINSVPFSSDTKLTQTIGRLRKIPNREVMFFDINDTGLDSVKKQLRNKERNVYSIIGKTIIEYKYDEKR